MTFVKKEKVKKMQTEKEEDDKDELDGESFDSIFESQSNYWKIPSEKELYSS